jgi:hypothetical protein
MGLTHSDRIQKRTVAGDDADFFQPFQPGLRWRLRQADAAGKFGCADPAIGGENAQILMKVPLDTTRAFQGILLMCVLAADVLTRYRIKIRLGASS